MCAIIAGLAIYRRKFDSSTPQKTPKNNRINRGRSKMTLLSRYIVDVAEDGVGGLDDRPQIPGIEDIVFDQPRVRVAAPPRGVVVDGASRAEMQRGVVSAGGRGRGGGSTMTEQQGNGTKPNTGVEDAICAQKQASRWHGQRISNMCGRKRG